MGKVVMSHIFRHCGGVSLLLSLLLPAPVWSQTLPAEPAAALDRAAFDLDPQLISPVLQRWLKQIPDVAAEIKNAPSFRSRLRFGYSELPATPRATSWYVGIADQLIGQTPLTVSADYSRTRQGDRSAWGTDLHYYVRPLGSMINLAPVVGYRHLATPLNATSGINLGARLLVVLSRGGGADFSVTQTWVAPGRADEIGLTKLSFGYALTHNLRLSTDVQRQTGRTQPDSQFGIGLEWLP